MSISVDQNKAIQGSDEERGGAQRSGVLAERSPESGCIVINADDWGRDRGTTDSIHDCLLNKAISSTSGMVFMEDSERAAEIARGQSFDVGLHLNFTTDFSGARPSSGLRERQQKIGRFLRRNPIAQTFFHPGLASAFKYVVQAQLDEFERIYGQPPTRIDGHHHMHLCANVLLGGLLPRGTIVRRGFSSEPGKSGGIKQTYRRAVDRFIARRHRMTDSFFSLPPLNPPERLRWIFGLAENSIVEVETHPVNREEYAFLMSGEIFKELRSGELAAHYVARSSAR